MLRSVCLPEMQKNMTYTVHLVIEKTSADIKYTVFSTLYTPVCVLACGTEPSVSL